MGNDDAVLALIGQVDLDDLWRAVRGDHWECDRKTCIEAVRAAIRMRAFRTLLDTLPPSTLTEEKPNG